MKVTNINPTQNPIIECNEKSSKINKDEEEKKKRNLSSIDYDLTISNLVILQNQSVNIEKPIPKDTTSTSTGTDSNSSQQENNSMKMQNKKLSFSDKTKQWAGNIWNSIKKVNIKNVFTKTEYKEIRNANGDIIKVPKKKIPLKKKNLNENVNNRINMEHNKCISNYHGVATDLYIMP